MLKLPIFGIKKLKSPCFVLNKTSRPDAVSAYLFILFLEILFTIVKNNKDIISLNILGNIFLSAYAADTTFFLK